jgi:hypothetical protein
MKRIDFKIIEEKYELEEIEIKYLYPYFFRFENKHKIKLLQLGTTNLSENNLLELSKYLTEALRLLLIDCYSEPSNKMRQKHPTFFVKFFFEGEKYVVDYTTSILGRLMYTLYLRLQFIEKAIKLESTLTITIH